MLIKLIAVAKQVLVLFALIAVGYGCTRKRLLHESAVSSLNNIILYVAIPCTLINAFQLKLTRETLYDFLVSLGCAAAIYAFNFLVSHFLVRDPDPQRKRLLTLCATVPNCNFMGFPLQTAILGSMGVFYGSAYAGVTPLFIWTAGVIYLNGGLKSFNWKKAFLNPGIFGIFIGLAIFFTGITLPGLVDQAVTHLANLAIPLPMIVIGSQLARTDLRRAAGDRTVWVVAALRLVLLPLTALLGMYLAGVRGAVLIATTIAAAAPPAVIVAMFDKPGSTAGAEVVSLQTLCSVLTMPVVVSLAQAIA